MKKLVRSLLPGADIHVRIDRELMLRYVARTIDPNGTIVDVGACSGSFTESLVKMTGLKPANCHLIEADPANFAMMQRLCPDYVNVHAAIAAQTGEITLYTTDDPKWKLSSSSKSNTIFREVMEEKFGSENVVPHRVPSFTMGDYLRHAKIDRVEFVMINCEGGEYQMFGDPDWLDQVRMVWIDLHGRSRSLFAQYASKRQEIYDIFLAKGFTRVGGHRQDDLLKSRGHLSLLFERLDWPASKLNA